MELISNYSCIQKLVKYLAFGNLLYFLQIKLFFIRSLILEEC